MEKAILLDTDVLVDFFRGFDKAVAFVKKYNDRIMLSSIVVAELYAGVKGDAEQNALQHFISLFRVVPIDAAIGKAGGLYRRDYGKSHGVGLANAILAATAESENAELKTLNIKHYPMFKNLSPAYKK
ncbi:twitching motility protein PilT [Desulfosarcina ovata subsp. sediminis]|uniref:Twitching motility protein PilT n=1 Tax=Desulfosarcina ovata subsp. sediminis TaxID=885957 RepID=A0A5K7ZQR7_9BACT|nr:type II toxin-antitoxin system VapC family toxin [Desulfosarcina ovata]BBO82869.1 twitching motility protein PilT [Desulfosarcina ovata subsp. sediminis]